MSSPSPYPYPSSSPSSPPFSFTPTPGSLSSVAPDSVAPDSVAPASVSPEVFVSYMPMPSYSSSPLARHIPLISTNQSILSRVSDDALYGIICAIAFVVLYSSVYAVYYYRKYKKEKLRLKRLNELQGKVHSSVRAVLNPVYPA